MSSRNSPDFTTPLLEEQRSSPRDEGTTIEIASGMIDGNDYESAVAMTSIADSNVTAWRILTTFWSFMVVGAIDGGYGVMNSNVLVIFRVLN